MPTTVLLPQVLDAVNVPVIAAGGIMDAADTRAALAAIETALPASTEEREAI